MKAAEYFRIEPTFWTGPTGKAIRAMGLEARVVATYLLTGSTASALGLYYLPLPLLVHESGVPFEGATKALRSLQGVGFAYYDQDAEVVWVPQMARIQVGPSLDPKDNRVKWLRGEAARCRRLPFFAEMLAAYGEAFHLDLPMPERPKVAPVPVQAQPDRRPFEAPSKPTATATTTATTTGGERPPTATNDQVRATFEAACRGLSLSLTYGHRYILGAERVMACRPKDLAEVEAVAAHYRKGLEAPAKPSWDRFCEKYDERRAQWRDAQAPASTRRDKAPNRSRATSVPGHLYCEAHGANYPTATGCRGCTDEQGRG